MIFYAFHIHLTTVYNASLSLAVLCYARMYSQGVNPTSLVYRYMFCKTADEKNQNIHLCSVGFLNASRTSQILAV